MSNVKTAIFAEKQAGILTYLSRNGEPGLDVGFQCLSEFYTHKTAGITDWTGFPSGGKTYFVFELLITLSEKYGLRHGLYCPDIGNYNEIWTKIFIMVTGKNINEKYGNKAKEEDIYKAASWINHHFIIMERADIKKPVSPVNIWEYVCNFQDDTGGLNTCLIDSWKNLYHDFGNKREDLYLDYVLNYRNELADKYQKHFHTIAHSAKTEIDEGNTYTDEVTGAKRKKRRIPDANDIKGGGSWFASGKNIITIDYPNKRNNTLDIIISKTKPEGVGKTGTITGKIKLDYSRSRYYEEFNGQRRFSFDKPISNYNTIDEGIHSNYYETNHNEKDGAPF